MKILKLPVLVILLISLMGNIGCNQFESFTNFTIDYVQDAKIESSTGINLPFNIATPAMETNAEQKFRSEDTRKEYIKSIFLNKLEIEIVDPPNEDFSFLEEVSIFIKSPDLEEVMIASKKPVPTETGSVLALTIEDIDLQDYIKSEEFTLRLKAVTDELITRDHYIKIRSSYAVSAKLND